MALTADRKNEIVAGGSSRYRWGLVGNAVLIYKGATLCWNATGYLVPAAPTLGFTFAGIAQEKVDNSAGAAGALECKYLTGVSVKMVNSAVSAIAQAHMGKPAYVEDDQTIRSAPGSSGVIAGVIERIDADAGVWLFVSPEAAPGAVAGEDIATTSETQTAAGVSVVYTFDIADAATADYDRIIDQKFEVFDVVCIKDGAGAANTTQVKNGATAITNAMATAVDDTITRPSTIDRAQSAIAAGGTLRVAVVRSAGSGAVKVFVHGVKRA